MSCLLQSVDQAILETSIGCQPVLKGMDQLGCDAFVCLSPALSDWP
jgi:hypothetical protein